VSLVAPTLQVTRELGIATTVSFITGYPEENDDDLDATLDLLGKSFVETVTPQLHVLSPEPGTPLFSAHELRYDGYATRYNAHVLSEGDRQEIQTHSDVFASYHYYPAALPRKLHIFAVEAVDTLRRVGPLVLGYALRFYQGRLSVFVRRLRGSSEDDVIDSLAAEHGEDHHLVSLFRYAFAADSLAGQPGAHLFHDIHDCARLVEAIINDRPLDDQTIGERGALLLIANGDSVESVPLDQTQLDELAEKQLLGG
jgi:hypothetical protein